MIRPTFTTRRTIQPWDVGVFPCRSLHSWSGFLPSQAGTGSQSQISHLGPRGLSAKAKTTPPRNSKATPKKLETPSLPTHPQACPSLEPEFCPFLYKPLWSMVKHLHFWSKGIMDNPLAVVAPSSILCVNRHMLCHVSSVPEVSTILFYEVSVVQGTMREHIQKWWSQTSQKQDNPGF